MSDADVEVLVVEQARKLMHSGTSIFDRAPDIDDTAAVMKLVEKARSRQDRLRILRGAVRYLHTF